MTTFIYKLLDPRDRSLKYIGKTTKPKERKWAHRCYQSENGRHLKAWTMRLKAKSLRPIFEIIEEVPEHLDWESQEQWWIAHFRNIGAALCNIAPGGGGTDNRKGHKRSPEVLAKISKACKGKGLGVPKSPEHRANIAAAKRRWWADKTSEQKMQILAPRGFDKTGVVPPNKGKKTSEETRRKQSISRLKYYANQRG